MRNPFIQIQSRKTASAFTLVELLVVISIIALLASLAVPGITNAQQLAQRIKDTNNLAQLGKLIKIYSVDNDGTYPTGVDGSGEALTTAPGDSNTALRELFQVGLLKDEKIFYTPGVPGAIKPDGDIGADNNYADALATGENCHVYVWGQSDSAESNDILACNPTVSGLTPTPDGWTVSEFLSRVWGGKGINVLYCDGSVSFVQKTRGSSGGETTVSTTPNTSSSGQVLGPDI